MDYRIEPIELTPTSGFVSHFFLDDADRVFACGLSPIHNDQAQSLLIFQGTTFPQGQGFGGIALTRDLPGTMVGEVLFRCGYGRLHDWLMQQSDAGIKVTGHSLGGSLSLLMAMAFPHRVSLANALCPAGQLFRFNANHPLFGEWEKLAAEQPGALPRVIVQRQQGDPVSTLGHWKKQWQVLRVIQSYSQSPLLLNWYVAHASNYQGMPGSENIVIDTEQDDRRCGRVFANCFIYGVMRGLLYMLLSVVKVSTLSLAAVMMQLEDVNPE